ncbi:MAG: hypothetical protein IPJ74_23425 [Saprospiraceae bacterium]|nr:hypothetical protein [Saprospiraceae bacterium]
MSNQASNKKLIKRIIGIGVLIILAYLFYTSLPTIVALAANTFYLAVAGIVVIGIGYVIYRLFK